MRKRNGAIVSFDKKRIEQALTLAIQSIGGTDLSNTAKLTDLIVADIEETVGNEIPDVEKIQDSVEKILIKE